MSARAFVYQAMQDAYHQQQEASIFTRCDAGRQRLAHRSAGLQLSDSSSSVQRSWVLLLMIEILHDLRYQNLKSYGSIVYVFWVMQDLYDQP